MIQCINCRRIMSITHIMFVFSARAGRIFEFSLLIKHQFTRKVISRQKVSFTQNKTNPIGDGGCPCASPSWDEEMKQKTWTTRTKDQQKQATSRQHIAWLYHQTHSSEAESCRRIHREGEAQLWDNGYMYRHLFSAVYFTWDAWWLFKEHVCTAWMW